MAGKAAPGRRLFHLEATAWTDPGDATIGKAYEELKEVAASAK
jgi:hypothetical protein